MEYQALYRKYRPTKFSDVVDQENILKIITNSIKENKISHAYLIEVANIPEYMEYINEFVKKIYICYI